MTPVPLHILAVITTLITLYFFSRWAPAGEDAPYNPREKALTSMLVFFGGGFVSIWLSLFATLFTIGILIAVLLLVKIVTILYDEWSNND